MRSLRRNHVEQFRGVRPKPIAERPRVTAQVRVLWTSLAAGVALFVSAPFTPWQVALLLGWDAGAIVFVVWEWWDTWRLTSEETRELAKREDDFEGAAHVILVMASLVSLVGVGFDLYKASQEGGLGQAIFTAVAVLTVVISWLAVQIVFTVRYARLYFDERGGLGGGIDFHQEEPGPDYRDFAYVAFTLGMTYQVSDTDVSSRRIRRTVLRHAAISYVFGVSVVAVLVNVVAGLLSAG